MEQYRLAGMHAYDQAIWRRIAYINEKWLAKTIGNQSHNKRRGTLFLCRLCCSTSNVDMNAICTSRFAASISFNSGLIMSPNPFIGLICSASLCFAVYHAPALMLPFGDFLSSGRCGPSRIPNLSGWQYLPKQSLYPRPQMQFISIWGKEWQCFLSFFRTFAQTHADTHRHTHIQHVANEWKRMKWQKFKIE